MANLDENILTHHCTLCLWCSLRRAVVVQQILGQACSLCLPVAPDAHRTMMNMISSHHNIDRCMHLDTGNLGSAKLLHIVDVVNVVVLNDTEHTAHPSDNTGLLTVMDVAAADDMASDVLLRPAVILAAAHSITLHLGRAFYVFSGKVMVVLRIVIFSERNTAALAVADLTVLNNPSLRPVRTDHTVLISSRRRPCRCCLADIKSTERNVIYACFRRHKAVPAHVDFYFFLRRVFTLEVCVDDRLIFLFVLLGIPFVNRPLRLPGRRINLALDTLLERLCLV